MSLKRISSVWDCSKSRGNDRLLMLALADSANDDGYCWPGYASLKKKMACTSQGTITNAIKRQEGLGELYVDHRQQRGNRYLVCIGLTDDEIRHGLITYFEMSPSEIDQALHSIIKNRNKSKKQTNTNKSKNRTKKVRKIDQISPNFRHDPSITVNKPSNDADVPSAVSGSGPTQQPLDTQPEPLETTPVKARPRNTTFDAIVRDGFRIDLADNAGVASVAKVAGWFTSWCEGNSVKANSRGKAMVPGASPPFVGDELRAFLGDYHTRGIDFPNGVLAFVRSASQYRAKHKVKKLTKSVNPLADSHKDADKACPVCDGNGQVMSTGGAIELCECVVRRRREAQDAA